MLELKKWYLEYIEKAITESDDMFRFTFNTTTTVEEKAEILLIGKHQWYLTCFHSSIKQKLIAEIANKKIWEKTYVGGCFEDIYNDHIYIGRQKYINQLTVYDIALRLAIVKDDKSLFPTQKVYLHATPMVAYKWLYNNGFLQEKVTGSSAIIDIVKLNNVFDPLNSRQIEDLLCHLEKGIKRLTKRIQFQGKPDENSLDEIINLLLSRKQKEGKSRKSFKE